MSTTASLDSQWVSQHFWPSVPVEIYMCFLLEGEALCGEAMPGVRACLLSV